ncbi:MAG TPA: hypothetical protein VGH79_02590 [Gaiellaceae bacterium]|jgi:hypothetical protein
MNVNHPLLPVPDMVEGHWSGEWTVEGIAPETVAQFGSETIDMVVAVPTEGYDDGLGPARGPFAVVGVCTEGRVVAAATDLDADAASLLFRSCTSSWADRVAYEATAADGRECVVAERKSAAAARCAA